MTAERNRGGTEPRLRLPRPSTPWWGVAAAGPLVAGSRAPGPDCTCGDSPHNRHQSHNVQTASRPQDQPPLGWGGVQCAPPEAQDTCGADRLQGPEAQQLPVLPRVSPDPMSTACLRPDLRVHLQGPFHHLHGHKNPPHGPPRPLHVRTAPQRGLGWSRAQAAQVLRVSTLGPRPALRWRGEVTPLHHQHRVFKPT